MVDLATDELTRLRAALAERYEIGRELGRGGMSWVYLARDLRHQRDVAVKILRPDLAFSLGTDRFLREIRIEATLQHPHILPLHDSGIGNGLLYYVMPFVPGETLRGRLAREKQLPVGDALRIAREVADALGYAHSHNVVHRDIKPGNILLSAGHAVVADFGIARAITAATGDQVTEAGIALGTPEYMSPEQATGEIGVDGRTDLYALGCVLYEMLTGEPPFRGRTVQATLARHLHDPPPPLRVIRPQVPPAVEQAVMTALAKIPADRFATADDFVRALEDDGGRPRPTWPRTRPAWRKALPALVVLAILAGLGVWRLGTDRWPSLDPNRVMVFPLHEAGAPSAVEGSGEAVATYIGYGLEGAAPLRWLEAQDFVSEGEAASALTVPAARRISRAQGAGYYIDGTVLTGPDSVTVVLRLHDVAGDSVLRRSGASSRSADASPPQLGLRAVGELLPAILEPGRKVDLTPLLERSPRAIAHFLQGERAYRAMRFTAALELYQRALEEDSALAIAALKGAASANWLEAPGEDARLVALALARERDLPPRQALFARGLRDYVDGKADSAVSYLSRAAAGDSTWSEAWMVLGEVYYHLVPRRAAIDSLAESAFARAHGADSSFTPPIYHLAEIALRRGDASAAGRLLARLQRADPDSTFSRPLALMQQCVREGPGTVPWAQAAERAPTEVLAVANALGARGANPPCARAGFTAVLASSHVESHWGALLALQSLLAAMGRVSEVDSLLEAAQQAGLPGRSLYLLDAAAGGSGFERQAAALALERGRQYEAMPSANLWLLGEWEARLGSLENLESIEKEVGRRAATSGQRTDSLFARILAGQTARKRGDSTSALALLQRLTPSAKAGELTWQPWEAMAGERLALGEMLLAAGRASEADTAVTELDSHRAVVYLLYLPATLELRARAAESMGRPEIAARYRQRLTALRKGAPSSPPT
jgi:tetratricopeptide (TPR) repeat protein